MERRELLKMIAVLTGAVVVGGDLFLSGCKSGPKADAGFTPTNISLLDEIGETIIPTTDTPGAKAAMIGAFMKTMITDCYNEKQQAVFVDGLSSLETACKKANGKPFMECTAQQRHDFLIGLEKEAKAYNTKRDEEDRPKKEAIVKANSTLGWKDQKEFEDAPSHYYTMMKQLTLWGFFTSETGSTKTLRHVPVPTRYDGNFAYKKADKAWAE
jgi:Gluconate 2-dehydrogenase subunit 3